MDDGAPNRTFAARLAARTPQERAATSAANAIAALVAAEALSAFVAPAAGATLDALVVALLLNRRALLDRSGPGMPGARRGDYAAADLLAVIALVALVRLIGLATPFDLLAPKLWFLVTAAPVLAGVAATVMLLEPSWAPWRPARGTWRADVALVLGGVAAAVVAAQLLPRGPAVAGLCWSGFAIAAGLALLAGLALDRIVFADGLRAAARGALASPRWPLGAALAAIVALSMPSLWIAAILAPSAAGLAAAPRARGSLVGSFAAAAAMVLLSALCPSLR